MKEVATPYHYSKERIGKEQELVREAQNNPDRFDVLYNNYYEQIFLFILKRVETEDIAADVTSQVFLKALTNIHKYKSVGLPFGSWLYRIARNELYDQHFKNRLELVVSVESKGVWNMIAEIGEEKREEDYTRLHAALGMLTNEDMELIELRFFEKRQFKEIAEILELTENNAKVKTYRILDKLKKLLKNER
ncbi:MAG: RNA polymerase sigma factor [Bacteroidia bacterium]|jgi:RNA polymerase sigma-70 factor (ECF subfamily)